MRSPAFTFVADITLILNCELMFHKDNDEFGFCGNGGGSSDLELPFPTPLMSINSLTFKEARSTKVSCGRTPFAIHVRMY